MKVALAIYLIMFLWLVIATPYWIYPHSVDSHTTWECLANSCFKNTHKNVIKPKVWYNNLSVFSCFQRRHHLHYNNKHIIKNKHVCPYFSKTYSPSTNYHIKWWRESSHEAIHTINDCCTRNKNFVVTIDVYVFSYVSFKCLGDVWNVKFLTNHNMHINTYNQLIVAKMKIHMHRMNVSCTHASIHMMLQHFNHSNHFFFLSQFLRGPQLNLWEEIRGKMTRSTSHSKLKYKSLVCFACIRMATTTPTSSSRKLFENEKVNTISGKCPMLVVVLSSQKKVKGLVTTET